MLSDEVLLQKVLGLLFKYKKGMRSTRPSDRAGGPLHPKFAFKTAKAADPVRLVQEKLCPWI